MKQKVTGAGTYRESVVRRKERAILPVASAAAAQRAMIGPVLQTARSNPIRILRD